jgi:hypothetical protein
MEEGGDARSYVCTAKNRRLATSKRWVGRARGSSHVGVAWRSASIERWVESVERRSVYHRGGAGGLVGVGRGQETRLAILRTYMIGKKAHASQQAQREWGKHGRARGSSHLGVALR